ncbi:3'-5' exonuclease [Moraxella oblonga]|uniref:3'-5' exonuclease n=1 Tax=Moraxella oblonga TaxID=200413 RepID=UPI00082A2D30|nr:3'-5' exonuclease [Moraxella oblonga]
MTSTPLLVFDIETIPDLQTGRRLYDLDGLSDDDALTALIALRQAEAGNDFMRLPLHQVACLSFLWVENNTFNLRSLSLQDKSESEILATFLRACTKKATLISWNGANFDLPVLLYRMAHHKIDASALMNAGFQKNDYLYRYSEKHIDLMDKFSFGSYGAKQKLDTIASLCGFAGKGDIDGSQVVPMVQAGQWDKLTTYCESDVLNTWFVYLRYLHLTGKLDLDNLEIATNGTKDYLHTLHNHDGSLRHQAFLEGCAG